MTADDEIGPVVGMHHILRAEDLPVIPTIWHSIRLRPSNVLARNPTTDLCGEARNQVTRYGSVAVTPVCSRRR